MEKLERCPLCRSAGAQHVLSVSYRSIWEGLRREWGVALPVETRRAHEPGPDANLVRCDSCGLEYFVGAAPGDPAFYAQLTYAMPYHGDRWEFGVVVPRVGRGASVLDLGAGDGAFLRRAAGVAGRLVGVDHNPAAVEAIVASGFEGSTESFEEIAEREAGAFDVVGSFHTLEHLADVDGLVRAARACVRPGGAVYLSVPNRDRYGRRQDEPLDCPPHHLSRWSTRQLHELAQRFGFQLEAVHLEEPDLSHVWAATRERSRRMLDRLGARDDGHPLTRLWMKLAVGARRHRRAAARHRYSARGVYGHSMLAELRRSVGRP